jgi:hypothetical protein
MYCLYLYVHACIMCICMANQSASHCSPAGGFLARATGPCQWEQRVMGPLDNVMPDDALSLSARPADSESSSVTVEIRMSLSAAAPAVRPGPGRDSLACCQWAAGGQAPARQTHSHGSPCPGALGPINQSRFQVNRGTGP